MQASPKKAIWTSLITAFALINSAGSLRAAELQTSPGQPVCMEKAELQEYLLAMVQKDTRWMSELRSCAPLIGGAKVTVIESYDNDSGITLDLGLKEK